MPAVEQVAGTQTAVIGTEHELASTGGANNLPAQTVYVLSVDCSAMAVGDILELRLYAKGKTGGTSRVYDTQTLIDVQADPLFLSVPIPAASYARMTLKQTAGTGRAFDWSVIAL